MSTSIWILIVILAAVLGAVAGFFLARRSMQTYLKNNPPISEDDEVNDGFNGSKASQAFEPNDGSNEGTITSFFKEVIC